MSQRPRVTLASNINHSVYAAVALAELGILHDYLGPVLVDPQRVPWRWGPGYIRDSRGYTVISQLPLRRQVWPEVAARGRAVLHGSKSDRVLLNAHTLDAAVLRRLRRCDILHFHTSALVRSVSRAKAAGALIIADHRDVHPRAHEYVDPLLAGLEREFALADWVIANSDFAAGSLVANGVPHEKIMVIPLGVDLAQFSPDEGTTSTRRGPQILFVGSVNRRKGVDILLEAMDEPVLAGARLRVCGTPSDGELVRRLADHPRVELVGTLDRTRLIREYQSADVLVLPSRLDAFGLVAVEALACGTPVVASNACGVSALIGEFGGGAVVNVGDVGSLARHANHLADRVHSDPSLRRQARAVAERASWSTYQETLADWYQDVALPAAARLRISV